MDREVIVIGGGIAGLQCARELHQAGRSPLILERARGVGGRCATRRFEGQPIDFGPMFLHGQAKPFLQAIQGVEGAILDAGWPRRIQGQGAPCQPNAFDPTEHRIVLPGGINAFAKHLAAGLDIRLGTCIERVSVDGGLFMIHSTTGEIFSCRDLVVAMALEEILGLVEPLGLEAASICALLGMFASVPSLTLLVAYPLDTPVPDWDILYPEDSTCLQLVAQDFRKRISPRFTTLVIQARPQWSRERLEMSEDAWSTELLKAAAEQVGAWVMEPLWRSPHRWRYARLDRGNELSRPLLTRFQAGLRLGLAGDVFSAGGGVQAAWLSGSALARRLLTEE